MKTPVVLILTAVLVGLLTAAGCAVIETRPSSEDSSASPSPGADSADPRSTAELRDENASLRHRLESLEAEHRDTQRTLDTRKEEVKRLKDDRDDLKKDRDRWKKAAGKDD